jgi:hypothetical protein
LVAKIRNSINDLNEIGRNLNYTRIVTDFLLEEKQGNNVTSDYPLEREKAKACTFCIDLF